MSEGMESATETTQETPGINNLTDVAGAPNESNEGINAEAHPHDANIAADDNTWFLSDGVAGTGDKPDWFNGEKYKSVSEQAKGYRELEKKLGAFTGAPDDYENNLGADYDGIEFDPNDELLSGFQAFAKDSNMSQENYQNVLKMFVDYSVKQNETQENAIKESALAELEKIGQNPSQKINEMVQWFGQNFPNVEIDKFKNAIRTASDFEVLNTLRNSMGYQKIGVAGARPQVSHQELAERLNSDKYRTDPLEQKEVDRQYAILLSQNGGKVL